MIGTPRPLSPIHSLYTLVRQSARTFFNAKLLEYRVQGNLLLHNPVVSPPSPVFLPRHANLHISKAEHDRTCGVSIDEGVWIWQGQRASKTKGLRPPPFFLILPTRNLWMRYSSSFALKKVRALCRTVCITSG